MTRFNTFGLLQVGVVSDYDLLALDSISGWCSFSLVPVLTLDIISRLI